jgi:site-specific recombinase XerD
MCTKKVTVETKKVTVFDSNEIHQNEFQMFNKIKVLFWFRKSGTQKTTGSIMLRVTLNSERLEFGSTRVLCNVKDWDVDKQKVKSTHHLHQHYNSMLKTIEQKVFTIYINFETQEQEIDVRMLRAVYLGKLKINPTFDSIVQKFFDERTFLAASSIRSYKSKLKKFNEFCETNNLKNIKVDVISPQVMNRFSDWMQQSYYHKVFIAKCKQTVKTVMEWAVSVNHISKNNLYDYVTKVPRNPNRNQLSQSELQMLIAAELPKPMQDVADCFIFCTQTGFEYSGLKKLRFDADITMYDGRWCILANREKTDNERFVPLTDLAWRLIKKYKDDNTLPVKSNKHMNYVLKLIMVKLGIDRHIHVHMARRIFANECVNIRGMSPEATAKAMGQSDTKSVSFYAEIDKKRVSTEFKQ